MNLTPLAADSMGARSMAFLVETKDVRIVIDPSVRLGPYRNGLGPHETELERLSVLHDNIAKAVVKADVLTISHYHYDHHEPDYPDWCKDKVLLVKHPTENINKRQVQGIFEFDRGDRGRGPFC